MKERKGFTLIELLAVIVILAIIALIATPIIMGVIEDARKGANKDAALGFGKAVETAIATQMIKCPNMTIGTTEKPGVIENSETITVSGCEELSEGKLSIDYQGTKPEAVGLKYDPNTGKLTGSVTFGGQKYNVEDGSKYEEE